MRNVKAIAFGLAVAGVIATATAQAGITRSADATPAFGAPAQACHVQVSRSAAPGVFEVRRETLQDGSCVCNAVTGPARQGGSAEAALGALLQSHECSGGAGSAFADATLVGEAPRRGGFGTTALMLTALAGGGLTAGLVKGCKTPPCT